MELSVMKLFECAACGAPLESEWIKDGLCRCKYCAYTNIMPKDGQCEEVLMLLHDGDAELRNSSFERAYNAFSQAADIDEKEPKAYFGMALAKNRVKYIRDTVNKRCQPICFEITDRRFDSDRNFSLALEYASTEEERREYEAKAREIDYIREKFSELDETVPKFDTFICVKVTDADGKYTQDSVWAGKLYDSIKRMGLTPFYSERDIADRVGMDYEALILYALFCAKSMIIVCGNEDYLRTPWVQNEYSRYYAMLSDNEKANNSIMIAFIDDVIERIPGIQGKIQGVNLGSFDASQRIIEFVSKFATARQTSDTVSSIKYCSKCAAENTRSVKFCAECGNSEFFDSNKKYCAECEAENSLTAKFCGECGSSTFLSSLDDVRMFKANRDERIENERRERDALEKAKRQSFEEKIHAEQVGADAKTALNSEYARTNFVIQGTEITKYIGSDTEPKIPMGITKIGNCAFYSKKEIKKVILPDTLITVSKDAFWDCRELEEITLPEGVTTIEKSAFWGCKSLKKIVFPKSVKTVAQNAFFDCPSLSAVYISDLAAWMKIDFANSAANPLCNKANLYLNGRILAEALLPEDTVEIKPFIFYGCRSLASVILPEGVKTIGKDAFYECAKLFEIVNRSNIPIAAGALSNGWIASNAVSVAYIPTLTRVGDFLFGTHKSKNYLLAYDGDGTDIRLPESYNGEPYEIYKFAFYKRLDLNKVTLTNANISAEKCAFEGCKNMTLAIGGAIPKSWHRHATDKNVKVI